MTNDDSAVFKSSCVPSQSGLTPLHLVAQEGHVGIADTLVKQGASIYTATRVTFIIIIVVNVIILSISSLHGSHIVIIIIIIQVYFLKELTETNITPKNEDI